MSQIFRERRSISPWNWKINGLKSVAIRTSGKDQFNPQSTSIHFSEYIPGADLKFEIRTELEKSLPEDVDLCIWRFCRAATDRNNEIVYRKPVKELDVLNKAKFIISGKKITSHNFGLRVGLVSTEGIPKILEEKVYSVIFDKPDLFPVFYKSFKELNYPKKALWKLHILADSPEEQFYRIDMQPNVSLLLNEDVSDFVIITSDISKRNQKTRLAHDTILFSIFTGALTQLSNWVFSCVSPDSEDRIPNDCIASKVYDELKIRLGFSSYADLYNYWNDHKHDDFPLKLQHEINMADIYRKRGGVV